jgi:hypothetical protein
MQELLLGPLLAPLSGTWGPQIIGYSQQYPWRVFAAVLAVVLLLDMLFRKTRSSAAGGDIGGFDFGDGDGGGCDD